jgi:hypothetical protein
VQCLSFSMLRQITNQLSKPFLKYSIEDTTQNLQYVDKPGVQTSRATKFCTVALTSFSVIIAIRFPLTYKKCVSVRMQRADRVRFTGHYRIVGPKVWICLQATYLAPRTRSWPLGFWKNFRILAIP